MVHEWVAVISYAGLERMQLEFVSTRIGPSLREVGQGGSLVRFG
jgi:hypothetical protein